MLMTERGEGAGELAAMLAGVVAFAAFGVVGLFGRNIDDRGRELGGQIDEIGERLRLDDMAARIVGKVGPETCW